MATSSKRNVKRGGYVAPFNETPDTNAYLLYNPSAAAVATTSNSYNIDLLPGMKGGNSNTDGGCASCGGQTSGGARKKRAVKAPKAAPKVPKATKTPKAAKAPKAPKATKATKATKKPKNGGMGLELAPFMSALALLGARLLADKELGIFNKKEKPLKPSKSTSSKKK